MADNITVSTAGGSETIGADEISSVKYTRNKLIYGADGSNSGDVQLASTTAGGLPVQANLCTDYVMLGGVGLAPVFVPITIAATADTTLKSAEAGKKIRVLSFCFGKVDAGTISLESTTSTVLLGPLNVAAGIPLVLPFNPTGWCETVSGELLNLALVTGTLTGGGSFSYVLI